MTYLPVDASTHSMNRPAYWPAWGSGFRLRVLYLGVLGFRGLRWTPCLARQHLLAWLAAVDTCQGQYNLIRCLQNVGDNEEDCELQGTLKHSGDFDLI